MKQMDEELAARIKAVFKDYDDGQVKMAGQHCVKNIQKKKIKNYPSGGSPELQRRSS